jgi:vancomycin resistance protein YoaR
MPSAVRIFTTAVAGLVLFAVGSFGLVRWARSGEVLPGVTIAGTDIRLGGLTPDEVRSVGRDYADLLAITPVTVRVNEADIRLTPETIGLDLDGDRLASAALTLGREGAVSDQFRWWIGHLFSGEEVSIELSVDPDALETVLSGWDLTHVGVPPVPGAVSVEGTEPVPDYPHSGRRIERSEAASLLIEGIRRGTSDPITLPIGEETPRLTPADVDRAVDEARLWLSGPVTLSAGEVSITFTAADLASALVSTAGADGLALSFDPGVVESVLTANRATLESAPVDASLDVGEIEVRIIPGRSGTVIDPVTTAEQLAAGAASVSRRGVLPFVEGAPPAVTTEDLEALGIRHLVSSFTTYHDCCQSRVVNIQLFADAMDGAMIAPGEEFDVNAYVGERTSEKGYLGAGTIVRGELVETIGGGVSQFATTLYNAVFWGGFEDITHRPHSFYFSRYPEGIEATISWPLPDLVFRNDSDHGVLIKTEYTATSITVKFYGDNDGRVVIGSHRNGTTTIDVVEEGGPAARRVAASVSGRYNPTEPTTEYRPNEELEVDEEVRVQTPRPGWSVTVTRTITTGGEETSEEWMVRYIAQREIIEVHPCRMPDAEEGSCPTTTTTSTTIPEETTTTTAP